MAHFLRGKQAGIPDDLSAGIVPELFAPDDVRCHLLTYVSSPSWYDLKNLEKNVANKVEL